MRWLLVQVALLVLAGHKVVTETDPGLEIFWLLMVVIATVNLLDTFHEWADERQSPSDRP